MIHYLYIDFFLNQGHNFQKVPPHAQKKLKQYPKRKSYELGIDYRKFPFLMDNLANDSRDQGNCNLCSGILHHRLPATKSS